MGEGGGGGVEFIKMNKYWGWLRIDMFKSDCKWWILYKVDLYVG